MIEAISANAEPITSHTAALRKSTTSGRRQEASISAGAIGAGAGPPGLAELGCDGEEMTLMQPAAAYSNWLGFAGAAGGTAVAFSTRAIRLERAAAGFCQSRSASFIASAIGSRTTPLAWSTQP